MQLIALQGRTQNPKMKNRRIGQTCVFLRPRATRARTPRPDGARRTVEVQLVTCE